VKQLNSRDLPLEMNTQLRPGDMVIAASEDGETVLLDLSRGEYYTLNATAGYIWRLICKGATPATIAQALSTECGIAIERGSADVQAVLGVLVDARLVYAGVP